MNDGVRALGANQAAWKRLGWGLAFVVLVSDQITKWWILSLFQEAERPIFKITSFFNIVLAWNPGISFGMFGNAGAYSVEILIGLTLTISAVLAVWLMRAETRLTAWGLGLIVGGAIGNVIDRFRFGAVMDFLDVHVLGYHWPTFNIADSAIVIGAGALMWEALFAGGESPTNTDHKKH
ncbi:MAG: signal peptidase II [Magnetovibrio sp.]|nr:signal peptidase II [Magnetovibrio sp.]